MAAVVDNCVEVRGIEPRSGCVPTCGFRFRLHRSPPVLTPGYGSSVTRPASSLRKAGRRPTTQRYLEGVTGHPNWFDRADPGRQMRCWEGNEDVRLGALTVAEVKPT